MDRKLEEFHLMGIFDIYREAYKVTLLLKKIFSQIALALILPLAIIFPVQIFISALVMNKIQFNLQNIDVTQIENPEYISNLQTQVASEMIIIYVSQIICGLLFVIFSLLPTSAVVYTVACIYCSKDITFKKVMSAVPKLWKRLMITFLWFFLILFVCNFIYFLAIMLMVILFVASGILSDLSVESLINMSVLLRILAIPYMIGAIYISLVWYMASVVSILEDIRGIEAMKKGKNLIKGKIWIVFVTYILLQICNTGVLFSFSSLAVHGEPLAMVFRVSYGIFCLLLLVILLYFGLVIQTIIYFVCKSHHKENIDKSNLGDHLDGYHLGHYVPLSKDEDIQLTGTMDRKSEEIQSMGIFDIYREAYKVTMSSKKIFSQIALALILPFALITLAQIEIIKLHINNSLYNLIFTLLHSVLFQLLSSAIAYTVACKVMIAIPKLWKRLMITFLWVFLISLVYNILLVILMVILFVVSGILSDQVALKSTKNMSVLVVILLIPYMIGAIYIGLIWYVSSIVSVLEDNRGIKALKKGKNLIKGNFWIVFITFFLRLICNIATVFSFSSLVVHGESLAVVVRVILGICYFLLLVIVIHFGLVTQTIVYFVCNLSDLLDDYYLGYYVPLNKDEDLQLGGNAV
ncbi:hypothetical protein MKW92_053373 [Papaver armeniacum]|nr:hypothetical protein MKW92_053373 [Papaver armeniacum]